MDHWLGHGDVFVKMLFVLAGFDLNIHTCVSIYHTHESNSWGQAGRGGCVSCCLVDLDQIWH